MRHRMPLLIAAMLLAAIGTSLIALYVRGADARAAARVDRVPVYVVKKSYPPGTKVYGMNFQTVEYLRASVPDGAVRDLSTLAGKVTIARTYPGQPVVAAMFGTETEALGAETAVSGAQADQVVFQVQAGNSGAVAAQLRPGATVTLWVTARGTAIVLAPRVSVVQVERQGGDTRIDALLLQAPPQVATSVAAAVGGGGNIYIGIPGSKADVKAGLRADLPQGAVPDDFR